MAKYEIEVFGDYCGYLDYWSGHGHAFAPDTLVACFVLSTYVTYKETVRDIKDALIDDLRRIGPESFMLVEDSEIEEEVSALDIEKFIEEELFSELKDEEKFFSSSDYVGFEEEEEDIEDIELPSYLIILHVHKKIDD